MAAPGLDTKFPDYKAAKGPFVQRRFDFQVYGMIVVRWGALGCVQKPRRGRGTRA